MPEVRHTRAEIKRVCARCQTYVRPKLTVHMSTWHKCTCEIAHMCAQLQTCMCPRSDAYVLEVKYTYIYIYIYVPALSAERGAPPPQWYGPSLGTFWAAEFIEISKEFQRICLVDIPQQLDAPQSRSGRPMTAREAQRRAAPQGGAGFSMTSAVVVIIEFVEIPREFQQMCLIDNSAM